MPSFACSEYIECWYLYYYFTDKDNRDYLTRQMMDFKADKKAQLDAFSKLSAEYLAEQGLKFDYVLRVLGSEELTAKKGARVRNVAMAISRASSATYHPLLLSKSRPTKPLKYLKKSERIAELADVYRISDEVNLNGKRILVVDDISTTGASLEAIGVVIKEKFPNAQLFGFCVAHAKSLAWEPGLQNGDDQVAKYQATLQAS